jgi:hypothetical protein
MKHIFYLIAIFFILYEITWVFSPIKKAEKSRKYFKILKGKFKVDDLNKDDKSLVLSSSLTSLFYLIWMFIGLFTFNWPAFLAFLIFMWVILAPLGRLTLNTKLYPVVNWIGAVIGVIFGLFVILNSYHFKMDLMKMW